MYTRLILLLISLCILGGCRQVAPPPLPTVAPPLATLTPTVLSTAPPTPAPSATYSATATALSPPSAPTHTPTTNPSTPFVPLLADDRTSPTLIPPTATATLIPPTWTPTPFPALDFPAIRRQLQANGQELAFVKIGFHAGLGTDIPLLTDWMRQLDAAGVPFFLKSVDNAEPLFIAQQLRRASGVPHVLVYRRAGNEYDVPAYHLPATQAAQEHWQRHLAVWPPELDPTLVWLETINEVDKNRADWLGDFALHTAELALNDGYRWAAFGWAAGEPEIEQWQTPAMLSFLRLAGQHPDQLAVALHEYSLVRDDIKDGFPYKIGRFQDLFRLCDAQQIPRPTILITEWGWTYQEIPSPEQALADIAWAAQLYAPHPQIQGAAIWFLGDGFGHIAEDVEDIIRPLTAYAVGNYFTR